MIERALSLSVPLLIGMFTSLLGLGDLADKVKKIFKKITGRITGAIDGFIEKAGAWFKDKKGRRKERKDKKNKEKDKKKKGDGADSDKDKKKETDKKEEEEDNKSETDKRTDKQKKTAFDKGMQAGTDSIENSENTAKVISSQISQKKKQYQFDKLDAKLEKETAEVQTWSLSGKLDQNITTETINRPKTDDDLEIPFKMNGENHTLYFRNGKLFMASKFGELIDKLDETIKALDNTDLESIDVDGLLKIAERVIKRGKSKEGKKLTKQSRILEAAQQLITELQDLDVQNEELKGDIGTLDDLSKDAVDEVAEKHQTALDQKVASFVNSTVFKSDNNKLGRSLVIDGSGNLNWAKTGSSTNYVVISRAVAIKIKNEHGNKGDNYQSRGPVRKRDGSTQINLEMKPNDVEWNDYNDPHFTRVGYCNYHINVKT